MTRGADQAGQEAPPLAFCDHHRQRYAEKVPIIEAGEFLVGDYRLSSSR
jgi:hypothetical protein